MVTQFQLLLIIGNTDLKYQIESKPEQSLKQMQTTA